jgi:hypothetical protein
MDLNPGSQRYATVIGRTEMPGRGDEDTDEPLEPARVCSLKIVSPLASQHTISNGSYHFAGSKPGDDVA